MPKAICKRISTLSDSKETFRNTIPEYEKALTESGFSHDCKYDKKPQKCDKKQRKRKILWYNPPYSKNVATNVGKEFFKLLDRHFPEKSPLHKIFNRNTVKLSYSCMQNMSNIISSHNKSILNPSKDNAEDRSCSCPKNSKSDCPLDGQCLSKNIIYKAVVSTENTAPPINTPPKQYIGLTSTTFKERFNNHTQSFKARSKSNSSELSKYVWQLKDKKINFNIKWSIVQKAAPYNPVTKRCNLCLAEKYQIMIAPRDNTLNKRSELISKCRHKTRYQLSELGIT